MNLDTSSGWPSGAAPSTAFCGEEQRTQVLAQYGLNALEDDEELTAIVGFAARLCATPVALVSIVETERQRFLAREGLEARETPRSLSFCAHAMLESSPMEVPDATRDARFADNELVTGELNIRFYAGAPLITPEGTPLGALCVIDRTPRPDGLTEFQREGLTVLARAVMRRLGTLRLAREAAFEQTESQRRMREIADLLPAIVWSADGKGEYDYFNSRWTELVAAARPNTTSDWREFVHPDDVEGVFAAWQKSFEHGEAFESEYRLRQADGSWRWTLSRALPFHDESGAVARWYGILTDINDGHRLSEDRALLARELSHRIKNVFAVLGGLVTIRARKYPESRDFSQELTKAILALGRAHEFVGPVEGKKGESLRGLLAELMAPYEEARQADGRIRIEGGDCKIAPRAATPLALVFHELATNAVKYGALSTDAGWVEIHLDCPESEQTFTIAWRERGGPPVSEPGEEGFGSRLLRTAVDGQLGGKLERRFEPEGLEIDIELKSDLIRR